MTATRGRATDLAVVVSPNGLGHARRTLGVLLRLLGMLPDLDVVLVAEAGALRRFEDWPTGRAVLDRVRIVDGVVAPGPMWSADPAAYADGRLLSWEQRLATVSAVHDAQLLVSDNLAGALSVRPDAVLMGSFLLSDVLDSAHRGHAHVDAFVIHERDLLDRHRPPMLCVGPIAMPGVLERSDAVSLAWMCESPTSPLGRTERPSGPVAVLGGRTGAADALLAAAASALLHEGIRVATTSGLAGTEPFDHSAAAFAHCTAVVARPGLGTVHDCIGAAVPMVLAYEAGNVELAHNAARLDQLGFGCDAGANPSTSRVAELVAAVSTPTRRARVAAAMEAAPRDGLAEAAAWLRQRLEGS